jgi:hypothetical protein
MEESMTISIKETIRTPNGFTYEREARCEARDVVEMHQGGVKSLPEMPVPDNAGRSLSDNSGGRPALLPPENSPKLRALDYKK